MGRCRGLAFEDGPSKFFLKGSTMNCFALQVEGGMLFPDISYLQVPSKEELTSVEVCV